MHIDFLVEEESIEAALINLVPMIVGESVTFHIHPHQGKLDLLRKLPGRLKGYRRWLPDDWRIVILVDEDRQDCKRLKKRLEKAARDAGLVTQSMDRPGSKFHVLNRLAIEELEAWFFGDIVAFSEAYPRIPRTLQRRKGYRNPDAIRGGTWEAMERILQRAGYYPGGLPKIEAARNISAYMDPKRNISKSFQVFKESLEKMTA